MTLHVTLALKACHFWNYQKLAFAQPGPTWTALVILVFRVWNQIWSQNREISEIYSGNPMDSAPKGPPFFILAKSFRYLPGFKGQYFS